MCFGGFWGAICAYSGLQGRSAEVICDQLGFPRKGTQLPYSGKLFEGENFREFRGFSIISECFFREIWGVAYLKGCGI
jgi:hypothetical protein